MAIIDIITKLKNEYPTAKCSLNFNNPLELLISTILAAQCTDERVNIVTKDLFNKYKTIYDFAIVNINELESDIKSTGFYHNKAKNIKNCCNMIINDYNGIIPQTMEKLVKLPGVGRKTANVLLGDWFGKNEGVVVDTHCSRISQRLGLTANRDPEKIERDLMKIVPKKYWSDFGHLMVYHGRAICKARKAECEKCVLYSDCPKINI